MIDCFDDNILKNQLIDGSSVAFKSGGFQPADAAPDNGLDATVVPVEPSEHFTAFSADDDLGGSSGFTAVVPFLTVGAGFTHSPADKFFLYLQINVFRNNGFVVAFYIVLRNKTVILNSGFVKKVSGVGLFEAGASPMYFSLRRILLMVLVCHFFPPAPVRIPSRSRPAAILSILRPSKYSR